MMQLYYVNTFIGESLLGNPAAVLLLDSWLSDDKLQSIAVDIGLPATAFVISEGNKFFIRWFTPDYELDLCGHGTLAAAHVIFDKINPDLQEIHFQARTLLKAKRESDLIYLDLSQKILEECPDIPLLTQGLGNKPKYIFQHNTERCLAIFQTETEVRTLKPDMSLLKCKSLDFI